MFLWSFDHLHRDQWWFVSFNNSIKKLESFDHIHYRSDLIVIPAFEILFVLALEKIQG